MSQTKYTTNDGVPLFACTKCNSRHPFEELSQGHQLCKNCKGSNQVIKCNYCRAEFQQDATSSNNFTGSTGNKSSSICKKCEKLQAQHGKPGPCAYCNIIAAFIGTKCQRCTNSEKKYGQPLSCEQCRQKCAFDRKDPESRKKVDGKLLCWLCTMAYKRTLAKAKHKEVKAAASLAAAGGDHHHHHHHHHHQQQLQQLHHHHHTSSSQRRSSGTTSNNEAKSHTNGHSRHIPATSSVADASNHKSSSHHHRHSSSSRRHSPQNRSSRPTYTSHRDTSTTSTTSTAPASMPVNNSSSKKQRLEMSSIVPSNSLSESSRFIDPNHGDLAGLVTQLKDQVAMLNKRLQLKEKELLSKDQNIADLKSTNTREHRELREKINSLQKQHSERVSEMQAKLVTMQKQMVSQSKASNKPNNVTSGYVEPPLVI